MKSNMIILKGVKSLSIFPLLHNHSICCS